MKCTKCGAGFEHIKVVDSRPKESTVYRRRYCEKCGYRFTTYEISEKQKAQYEKTDRWKESTVQKLVAIVSLAE